MTPQAERDNWLQRLSEDAADREHAIEELRNILIRGLSASLSTRYGGRLEPEDVVQEALMKILGSLDSFQGRSRFTTWAMTIATRVGISELRRKHYQDVSLDAITAGDNLSFELAVDDSSPASEQHEHGDILQLLHELIETELTERQRQAIRALLEGLPVEEFARHTGSNRNAVYKLIHDARTRLHAGFERAGVTSYDISAVLA